MKSEPTKDLKGSGRLVLTTLKPTQSRDEQKRNLIAFLERLGIKVIPSSKAK